MLVNSKSRIRMVHFHLFTYLLGVPVVVQRVKNLNNIHEDAGSILGLAEHVKIPVWPQGAA